MRVNLLDPRIYPAKPEDIPLLTELATPDNHAVVAPSHVVKKDGRLIGYVSIGTIPMAVVYLNTKETTCYDSATVLNFVENTVAQFSPIICTPCATKSPLFPYMERIGYLSYGTHEMFIKSLTERH
jgi:hypothetical protein